MVYAFAILDKNSSKIVEFDPEVDLGTNQFYAKFVDLKKQNSKLKTTIAIGGWDDSHNGTKYSDMVASPEKRKIFVDSVMEFLDKYKFDGLDIDWEYPSSSSDKAGLAELMKELRAKFQMHTPPYSLTIAVGVNLTISDLGLH
jgi:chitinase